MVLHTLNKSTFGYDLSVALTAMSPDDSLLLIEDGVYTALDKAALSRLQAAGIRISLLTPDAEARGITDRIPAKLTQVTYENFVELACASDKTVAWF